MLPQFGGTTESRAYPYSDLTSVQIATQLLTRSTRCNLGVISPNFNECPITVRREIFPRC